MRPFIKYLSFFFIVPVAVFVAFTVDYVYNDPFKVIWEYDDYSNSRVIPNRDVISTKIFEKQNPTYKYNSFILGSSRTLAYRVSDWATHLDSLAVPFLFDASGESIFGILTKLRFLDEQDAPINNALIILCRETTFRTAKNDNTHLLIKHPDVTKESCLYFHYVFLRSFFTSDFLMRYYSYRLSNRYISWMKDYIENRTIIYDTVNNQILIKDQEDEIVNNPDQYYSNRRNIFYKRHGETQSEEMQIKDEMIKMLGEIKDILKSKRAKYKVVISPLYEQVRFSEKDIIVLKEIFGSHLYDFSGKNEYTDDIRNYYEASHYRPKVGRAIMNTIYQ